ncbi:MAG TPA: hypothetical protein VNS58_02605 [Puia sp.]|nr:hypothetical protein [Puia sp.]
MIEKTALDSILSKSPKRADIYWFLHVNVLDEPYALRYHVEAVGGSRSHYGLIV